jgi:hypothetical protein
MGKFSTATHIILAANLLCQGLTFGPPVELYKDVQISRYSLRSEPVGFAQFNWGANPYPTNTVFDLTKRAANPSPSNAILQRKVEFPN